MGFVVDEVAVEYFCFRLYSPVFFNRRAVAQYRALASIIPGRKRFSWNLSF